MSDLSDDVRQEELDDMLALHDEIGSSMREIANGERRISLIFCVGLIAATVAVLMAASIVTDGIENQIAPAVSAK
jgi:hypothetical protein